MHNDWLLVDLIGSTWRRIRTTYVVLRTGRRPKIGDGTRLCDENEEASNRIESDQFAHILGIRIYEKKLIPQQHIEKRSYDGLNLV